MQQVLFEIPVKAIADWFPSAPPPIFVALVLLAIGLGIFAERRRKEAGWQTKINFQYVGNGVAVLIGLIGLAQFVAQKTAYVPIFGYGAMLFLAFIACTLLADRLATREGMAGVHVQDLAIWMFIMGIVGARFVFLFIASDEKIEWNLALIGKFIAVWDGGLVFYGSVIGGVVGYFLCYFIVLRKHGVDSWKMADVIAPCVALGLCLGRVGCLLNGCCYGNVAVCDHCPAISFGLSSPPRYDMTRRGYQTPAGFVTEERDNRKVREVDPGSPAEMAGLKPGDFIEQINDKEVGVSNDLEKGDLNAHFSTKLWPHGQNYLKLTVRRNDQEETLIIPARTIGLHPTQIYESISMLLVFFLLLAYYPFRGQPGSVMVLFMFCYAIHRFLNEMLRTDTEAKAFNMTLSQNISIFVFLLGLLLAIWLRIKTIRARAGMPPPVPPLPA